MCCSEFRYGLLRRMNFRNSSWCIISLDLFILYLYLGLLIVPTYYKLITLGDEEDAEEVMEEIFHRSAAGRSGRICDPPEDVNSMANNATTTMSMGRRVRIFAVCVVLFLCLIRMRYRFLVLIYILLFCYLILISIILLLTFIHVCMLL